MKLLNVNYEPFENDEGDIDQMFWVYDTNMKDFMLRDCNVWFNVKSDAYLIDIDGCKIAIPETYSLIIGDIDAGIDVITPAEIVGREFDVLTINNTLEEGSWMLSPMTVIGFEPDVDIVFPYTKFPVPVAISDTKVVLISSDDCYNKVKKLDFADFV